MKIIYILAIIILYIIIATIIEYKCRTDWYRRHYDSFDNITMTLVTFSCLILPAGIVLLSIQGIIHLTTKFIIKPLFG